MCCASSQAIEQAAVLYDDYCRVITPENLLTDESEEVCTMLMECLELRRKWLFRTQVRPELRKVSSWHDSKGHKTKGFRLDSVGLLVIVCVSWGSSVTQRKGYFV